MCGSAVFVSGLPTACLCYVSGFPTACACYVSGLPTARLCRCCSRSVLACLIARVYVCVPTCHMQHLFWLRVLAGGCIAFAHHVAGFPGVVGHGLRAGHRFCRPRCWQCCCSSCGGWRRCNSGASSTGNVTILPARSLMHELWTASSVRIPCACMGATIRKPRNIFASSPNVIRPG